MLKYNVQVFLQQVVKSVLNTPKEKEVNFCRTKGCFRAEKLF